MPLSKRSLRTWSRWVVWVPATLLLLASATAVAADDAKAHYQKATAHFAVGEYHDAAIEYEEAFKLKQDPAILFNAAQSFRLAGDNQKALLLYNNIIKLYPSTHYAKDSKERIEKLSQSTTTAAPPTTTAPPPAPVTPIAPPTPAVVAPPPAIEPAPITSGSSAVIVSSPTSPGASEAHPIYTRWWFWTAIGVVAAGAAITVIAVSSGGSAGAWNNVSPIQAGLVR